MFNMFLNFSLASALFIQVSLILSSYWWGFELLTHYIPYYAITGIGLGLISLINVTKTKGRWVKSIVFFGLGLIHLYALMPYYLNKPVLAEGNDPSNSITLFLQNFNSKNRNLDGLANLIKKENPDIFLIVETPKDWTVGMLYDYFPEHEYLYLNTSEGADGFFMGSKQNIKIESLKIENQLSLFATIQKENDESNLSIFAVHPVPPLSKVLAKRRNNYLKELTELVNQEEGPIVVMGDFNSSPWSLHFKNYIEATNLKDSRLGHGLLTTWNARDSLFHIPIDYILLSEDIELLEIKKLDDIGSDHLGLMATIRW